MKTLDIESFMMNYLSNRYDFVVPRVTRPIIKHEADIICGNLGDNFLCEYELKVSEHDIISDLEKTHPHFEGPIKCCVFCVPFDLLNFALLNVPNKYGIISVDPNGKVKSHRPSSLNHLHDRIGDAEHFKILKLASSRIMLLTRKLNLKEKENNVMPKNNAITKYIRKTEAMDLVHMCETEFDEFVSQNDCIRKFNISNPPRKNGERYAIDHIHEALDNTADLDEVDAYLKGGVK